MAVATGAPWINVRSALDEPTTTVGTLFVETALSNTRLTHAVLYGK
jgi:hypothetical protein